MWPLVSQHHSLDSFWSPSPNDVFYRSAFEDGGGGDDFGGFGDEDFEDFQDGDGIGEEGEEEFDDDAFGGAEPAKPKQPKQPVGGSTEWKASTTPAAPAGPKQPRPQGPAGARPQGPGGAVRPAGPRPQHMVNAKALPVRINKQWRALSQPFVVGYDMTMDQVTKVGERGLRRIFLNACMTAPGSFGVEIRSESLCPDILDFLPRSGRSPPRLSPQQRFIALDTAVHLALCFGAPSLSVFGFIITCCHPLPHWQPGRTERVIYSPRTLVSAHQAASLGP